MTKKEAKFIEGVGSDKFYRALAAASLLVRNDARYIGMDKVRDPIAWTAAKRACGDGDAECPLLRNKDIAGTEAAVEFSALLDAAVEAAREKVAA